VTPIEASEVRNGGGQNRGGTSLQAFGDLPKAPWTTEIEELQRLLEAHGQKM
jgi:hypothetical protein